MSDLAERHFVGALLHLPAATVMQAADLLPAEWLSDVQVGGVYAAVIENAKAGISEPAAVVPTMLRLGLPADRHGIATGLVIDLMQEVPLPSSWRLYASLVATGRLRARVQAVGYALTEQAHRDPLDRLHAVLEDARLEVEAMHHHIMRVIGGDQAA